MGEVSSVPFSCSNSSQQLLGSKIVTCKCQSCEKLHAYIRGSVFSSHMHRPVFLAAILLGTEIVSFTDKDGHFFFELTTREGSVRLLIQEVHHRPVEVTVSLHTSLNQDVAVIMEYIEDIETVEKLQVGFNMELGDLKTWEMTGINASISLPPRSLLMAKGYEMYRGPGHVLHSLYHMDSRPEFTSSAVQSMVYRDSKGVDFSIQSHVSGSLRLLDEGGEPLALKQGHTISLRVALRFEMVVKESQVEGLHIFTYPDGSSHWQDNGKITIDSIDTLQYSSTVKLRARLREANLLWAIGFPSRITCYIKSKMFHLLTRQEQVGFSIQLEQSMIDLDRPSFYLASAKSARREGVCLKAVCGLGGLLYIRDTAIGEEVYKKALTPSTEHSVIMGDHDQVMFYNVEKGLVTGDSSTPYYSSEEECVSSTSENNVTGYFEFLVNISLPKLEHRSLSSSVITPLATTSHQVTEYCYIKVGAYNCAERTTIQVLSFSGRNHSQLLSMETEALSFGEEEPALDRIKCQESSVMRLRSACLQFACGSHLHVSATAETSATPSAEHAGVGVATASEQQRGCRYWSSHPDLTNHMHLSDAMTSFHLVHQHATSSNAGLYRSTHSKEQALVQCQGNTNRLTDRSGIAVTFIC